MGGMRALEWAVTHPERGRPRASCWPRTAYASADQIAWCQPQLLAIRSDPRLPRRRLLRPARRSPADRAGHRPPDRARDLPAARSSWTTGSAARPRAGRSRSAGVAATPWRATSTTTRPSWPRRFDANSYVVLTEAMNSPRRRARPRRGGGGAAACHGRPASWSPSTPTGSTRRGCPTRSPAGAPGTDAARSSPRAYGHDGFLIEIEQVGAHHPRRAALRRRR